MNAFKQKVTAVTESAKIADLQKDMQEQAKFLTTDHGVKVSETDNWSVAFTYAASTNPISRCTG